MTHDEILKGLFDHTIIGKAAGRYPLDMLYKGNHRRNR